MDNSRTDQSRTTSPRHDDRVLCLGYVPLVHAAPLLVAEELGYFTRRGLRVRLSREVGWATVREKILSGELDAAQALAPMPLAITLGLNCVPTHCATALVLNLHGNTLVLSRRLWNATQGDPDRLRSECQALGEPATFAVVYPHSTHLFVLRQWLREAGLMPDRDYRLVVVPPQQMVAHLKSGHLAGCCVGEPWGSLAVRAGIGVIAAFSADLSPGHAEKVLLVRHTFVDERPEQHGALVAALLEACAWCGNPANQQDLLELLSSHRTLSAPLESLRPAITGQFDLGAGRNSFRPDALIFDGPGVNIPTPERAQWLASQLGVDVPPDLLRSVYRADLFPVVPTAVPPSGPNLQPTSNPDPVTLPSRPRLTPHEPHEITHWHN